MKREKLLLIILAVLIIGGFFAFLNLSKKNLKKETQPSKPPPSIEEKSQVSPAFFPKRIYNLSGTIQKIKDNSIVFKTNVPYLNKEGKVVKIKEIREAMITPETKFFKLQFVKIGPNRKTPKQMIISFEDLKVGNFIEVFSNQDISKLKKFKAKKVILLP